MAEIETKTTRKKTKRIHKKSTKVDLTPMVDLGFLLITFFVFTTALSLPTTMDLRMPVDTDATHDFVCTSCVLTVFPAKNNTIYYYEGMPESKPEIKETSYSADGIRKILEQKKAAVKIARGTVDDFVLIIKPTPLASFGNFVDMMDEVTINGIKHYYTGEPDELDKKLLGGRSE